MLSDVDNFDNEMLVRGDIEEDLELTLGGALLLLDGAFSSPPAIVAIVAIVAIAAIVATVAIDSVR